MGNACRGALPSFVCRRLPLDRSFDPSQWRKGRTCRLLGPSAGDALPSFTLCCFLLDLTFDPAQCRQGWPCRLFGPSVLLARDGGQQYPDTPPTPLGTLRRAFFSFFFARRSLYISLRALYRASRQYSPIP